MDSLSKFQILSFMKTTTNSAFLTFPESHWSFCTRTSGSHFWTRCACAKAEICRFALEAGRHLWKRFVYEGEHGRVYWSRTCRTATSVKETFPNVWERMTWEVAFGHHRRERWYLHELWISQYCCDMIGLADSRNLECDQQTTFFYLGLGSAGLSLKTM